MAVVIDTNVLHVANQNSPQAGPSCVLAVVERLVAVQAGEMVCLDVCGRILDEYIRQRLNFAGQPGFGDAFFRWLFDNQANDEHCEVVEITINGFDGDDVAEFPMDPALAEFDRSDRKFVAVALSSRNNPSILNAVDSDWWDFAAALTNVGVRVENVCPEQIQRRRG